MKHQNTRSLETFLYQTKREIEHMDVSPASNSKVTVHHSANLQTHHHLDKFIFRSKLLSETLIDHKHRSRCKFWNFNDKILKLYPRSIETLKILKLSQTQWQNIETLSANLLTNTYWDGFEKKWQTYKSRIFKFDTEFSETGTPKSLNLKSLSPLD